jgi:hypothetical protein
MYESFVTLSSEAAKGRAGRARPLPQARQDSAAQGPRSTTSARSSSGARMHDAGIGAQTYTDR